MLNSLYIGATGMHAQQQNVDSIANNLANVNTTGFKKNRVAFTDAFYKVAGSTALRADGIADPVVVGMGTMVSSNAKSFAPGEIKQTNGPLDVAIRGNGFLEVQLPDGSSAYTRHGALQVTKDGVLGTREGYALKQHIQVPTEALEVIIDHTGKVSARMQDEKDLVELGEIELTMFANPEGLDPIGDNLFVASQRAGSTINAKPGEEGLGSIAQGFLESSNVQLAEEMVNLVLAQRAYELNAKVIQASDEMLSISNNLRR